MSSNDIITRLLTEIEQLKKEIQKLKGTQYNQEKTISFDVYALAEFFSVLSSPERLSIIKLLFEGGRYFSELEEILNLGPSSLRHHLSKLMRFGIITQERIRGKYIITELGRRVYSFLVDVYIQFVRGLSHAD